MRALARLLVVLVCCGCRHETATGTPPPRAVASARPAPTASPQPDAASACDELRRREGLTAASESDDPNAELATRFACDRASDSGWAVRFDADADAGGGTFTALRAGSRWSAPPIDTRYVSWPPTLEVHDFDGDGTPELFTTLLVGGGAREWVVSRAFVTFKNDRVAPYAPATALPVDHFEDVDQDGRPDLLLEYYVGRSGPCGHEGRVPLVVTLVAHTLPDGTFSLDDAVARGELAKRSQCTGVPTPIVSLPAHPDDAVSKKPIVCARLFGEKKERVLAAIDHLCAPYAASTRACSGPCRHVEDMRTLARFDPPVTFGAH